MPGDAAPPACSRRIREDEHDKHILYNFCNTWPRSHQVLCCRMLCKNLKGGYYFGQVLCAWWVHQQVVASLHTSPGEQPLVISVNQIAKTIGALQPTAPAICWKENPLVDIYALPQGYRIVPAYFAGHNVLSRPTGQSGACQNCLFANLKLECNWVPFLLKAASGALQRFDFLICIWVCHTLQAQASINKSTW